jgi:type IV pilus assembly protein PilB
MDLTLTRQPLGQLLLGRGVVAPAQLDLALAEQRKTPTKKLLGEILVESRLCSEDQVAEALAESYGVPFARVGPRLADPKVVSVLPREFLEREQVLPLFLVEGVLTVAVVEPANVFLLDEIRRLTGHRVQPVAATAADVEATLLAYLPDDRLFIADDAGMEAAPESFAVAGPEGGRAGGSPADRLVRAVLYGALRDGATDVHVEPDDAGGRVRYRIDGRLVERLRVPPQAHAALVARLKALGGAGAIRLRSEGRAAELRLAALATAHGEKLAIRVGDSAMPLRLEKLGFGYETLKQWRRLIAAPRGLLVVTGPAGGGKRTTLASSLCEMNTRELNVCAVEEPVERLIPGVNQTSPALACGGPATVLRRVLDQDPDVVMVAEVADPEAARVTAAAAMAGQLVMIGLHAADPAAAVSRLLALGVEPYVLAAALAGVLSQRLVRRLCPQCREAYDASPAEKKQLEPWAGPVATLYRPSGCARCRNTGYAGRIALFELLVPPDALTDAIARGAGRAELASLVQQPGAKALRADGAEKVKAGITTLDEFLCACTAG